jgi:hypothetical protein
MMRRRRRQGIVGTSARALDNDPDTCMRALKFEGNRRWRFCECIGTLEGDKCWIISDLSGSEISC